MLAGKKFPTLLIISIFFSLLFSSCKQEKTNLQRYYYSNEGLESSVPDTLSKVNIEDKKAIAGFLKGKVFISKTEKLVINDSLQAVYFVNGRKEKILQFEITEYLVHNERLLLLKDHTLTGDRKFTLSGNGVLTDMRTYSLYTVKR